jgi:hypothetical protein
VQDTASTVADKASQAANVTMEVGSDVAAKAQQTATQAYETTAQKGSELASQAKETAARTQQAAQVGCCMNGHAVWCLLLQTSW